MRKQWVILLLCTMILSSCGKIEKQYRAYTPDRNTAYLEHETSAPMVVPANLNVDPENMQNYYPLPEGPLPPPDAEPVDIVPPPVVKYEEETKDNG